MLAGLMRARRSCLSVPASSPGMLAKARALPADELVLDLEDSVLPDAKDEARAALAAALREGLGEHTVSVRINAVGTRWCDRDVVELVEAAGGSLDCLTIPKVESAGGRRVRRPPAGWGRAARRRAPGRSVSRR